MVPREIVVRAELPRSPNGKFDRTVLRRELTA
jgi:acyl-CoA synthetase (AMP-forming)/AMP-acid ligase II